MIVKSNSTNIKLANLQGSVEYILDTEGLNGLYRGLRIHIKFNTGPALVRNMSAGFLYFQILSYITSNDRNVS